MNFGFNFWDKEILICVIGEITFEDATNQNVQQVQNKDLGLWNQTRYSYITEYDYCLQNCES